MDEVDLSQLAKVAERLSALLDEFEPYLPLLRQRLATKPAAFAARRAARKEA